MGNSRNIDIDSVKALDSMIFFLQDSEKKCGLQVITICKTRQIPISGIRAKS